MFEKILFPVRKQKILHNGKETGRSMVIREDKDEFISVVSDDYLLIPNRLVVDNILKEFGHIIEMNKDRVGKSVFSNERYSSIQFDLKYPKQEVNVGDTVGAVLRVENSYDTTSSLRVSMNAVRLVCSNGMTANSSLYQATTRHLGQTTPQDVIREMLEGIKENGEEKFIQLNDTFRNMSNTKINPDIKEAFIKSISKHPNYVVDKIVSQIMETKPKDLWSLYNCVTYVSTHEMDRTKMSTLNTEEELNKSVLELLN